MEDDEYVPNVKKLKEANTNISKLVKPKTARKREIKKETPVKESRMKIWICKLCLADFPKKKDLVNHKLKEHPNAKKEVVMEVKYEYDADQEVYVCINCSAEFQYENEVIQHVETHLEKYECEECKLTITGAYSFSLHAQAHRHDLLYPCPCCSYTTLRRTAMMVHINRMHLNKYDFQCAQCGKCFNDALSFKEHDNVHLGLKPFICVVCNKEFVYSRYLTSHQSRLHTVRVIDENSKTQCKYCNKIFAKQETLENHLLKHETNKGPYLKKHLCDVCGQGFSRKDKLNIHYRKHSGEKPFSCSYCGKSFIKKDYMIMHERVHSGEKPYSCEFCGKCFNQGAPLRIHLRSHTGERPYICPYCSLGCISRGALNVHIRNCICSV
ncbi:unnamed protein product [Brassicogethes aeneus]|uniref:C2H2-type domain-containing protein n=1 Tax=Brassicogethes aeneus TaxID=1431903 RepID=A0A9P0AQV1_BRAAE|nr:unnamed protein product [Brassicogethes aeneus]